MSEKVATPRTVEKVRREYDDGYPQLEELIRYRVGKAEGPLFTTAEVSPSFYFVNNIAPNDPEHRQHYVCNACFTFMKRYGGLVRIRPETGEATSLLWENPDQFPPFFRKAAAVLNQVISASKVTGVFLSSEETWGTPVTGEWTHLSGSPPKSLLYRGEAVNPGQAMADKRQEFIMVVHALREFPEDVAYQAVRVLRADTLSRSEKTLGVAEWFWKLHTSLVGVKGPRRDNLIWSAVAAAPPGWAHVRASMIGTLLDDVKSGLDYETVARRWVAKMHPTVYQRPSATPKEGAVREAEKLVEKLGVASALRRRFAKRTDVWDWLWIQAVEQLGSTETSPKKGDGVFSHLLPSKREIKALDIPAGEISWERFARDVLPAASKLEYEAVYGMMCGYFGLVTAADPDAKPLLQWDGREGFPRNPVSWYFYERGSSAVQWNLLPELDGVLLRGYGLPRLSMDPVWINVPGVFVCPAHWGEPYQFRHVTPGAFLVLEGAKDKRGGPGGAFFPESVKSEYYGIRSVLEAHNRTTKVEGADEGDANGVAIQKGFSGKIRLRVTRPGGEKTTYVVVSYDAR